MWTKVRHLNHSQKQRITNNLFVAVAVGAVLTVAGPALLPCPAYDQNDKSAFLEDRKKQPGQSKKKVIIVKRRRDTSTLAEATSS
jgi:Tfp pilus assembly protein PilN